jgi:hypothetical protein
MQMNINRLYGSIMVKNRLLLNNYNWQSRRNVRLKIKGLLKTNQNSNAIKTSKSCDGC